MGDSKQRDQADGHFGWCPHCHNNDGYENIGREHWFVCDVHMTKWCAGANLISSWRHDTEEEQRQAAELLARYTAVRPVVPEYK